MCYKYYRTLYNSKIKSKYIKHDHRAEDMSNKNTAGELLEEKAAENVIG